MAGKQRIATGLRSANPRGAEVMAVPDSKVEIRTREELIEQLLCGWNAMSGPATRKPPWRPNLRASADAHTCRADRPARDAGADLERMFKAALADITLGITPAGLATAGFDWLVHLLLAPGKRLQLATSACQAAFALAAPEDAEARDRRFADDAWRRWPYHAWHRAFLWQQAWWRTATTGIDGLSPRTEAVVSFAARQMLDAASPANFPGTNPEIVRATLEQGGRNVLQGARNALEDWQRYLATGSYVAVERFAVGHTLAATPGTVVYQNRLIELIQYRPTTDEVHAEPILIVPAWIMKYYILDLTPGRSLVEYLVGRGHTVFILSWKNPGADDRDLTMADYRRLGIMAALDAVSAIVPERKIHAAGYCLGGTLLAITAATMGRDGDDRLATLTLLAAQSDFSNAGELGLFISESQVSYLEHMMWRQGYLDTRQMAGVFHILRAEELIWSRVVHDYWLGGRTPVDALMAWSADLTRMPYRMHSEYLRRLFLGNDLAAGRYVADGRPISLGDIQVPSFAVGTALDHVSPWRSVHKIHLQACREVTFVLSGGGHNSGIVSQPGHPRARFQIRTRKPHEPYVDPETWRTETPQVEGSWWLAWQAWLAQRSSGKVAPPPIGLPAGRYRPQRPAPGRYVRQH
jgi:polyhydroxyalkanoate synthase subunit PhaC